jgi:SnoaL-like domain
MDDPEQFMRGVLGMWTQTDAKARRAAIEQHFDPGARLRDENGDLVGYDAIDDYSGSLRGRYPDARFTLVSTDTMADAVRTIWTLGPPDRPDLVTGMDFALLENDRITRLYAFVDEPE